MQHSDGTITIKILGSGEEVSHAAPVFAGVPENLKPFLQGVAEKDADANGCCSTAEQETCCDADEKASCCGSSVSETCGCK